MLSRSLEKQRQLVSTTSAKVLSRVGNEKLKIISEINDVIYRSVENLKRFFQFAINIVPKLFNLVDFVTKAKMRLV